MTSLRAQPCDTDASTRSLRIAPLHDHVMTTIDALMAALPHPDELSEDQQRGIIARYTAVLEGNFIYWMTAAHLAAGSETARAIIADNLREEVRDNHPGMLRRFAMAAHAMPTDVDALAVDGPLLAVRRSVGRLTATTSILMMAFFEGFITRFMPYLADLARRRGSAEREYTDVHGVVDIEHTEGLFRALDAEMAVAVSRRPDAAVSVEGVEALGLLIDRIIHPGAERSTAQPAPVAVRIAA